VSKPLPTFHDVLLARRTIAPYLAPTPLHHYPQLDALLGATVFVKHENYQPIGAFKVRGGINSWCSWRRKSSRTRSSPPQPATTAESVAYAAQLFGVRAVIVVPEGANPVKVQAIRAYGAEVVFHGADFEASERHCLTLEKEQGLRFISSGDETLLMAGVATHTLEILEAQPDIDVIFVPVGGGSGCAGACLVAHTINPHIQVIGVAATGAPAGFLSWQTHTEQTAPIVTRCHIGLSVRCHADIQGRCAVQGRGRSQNPEGAEGLSSLFQVKPIDGRAGDPAVAHGTRPGGRASEARSKRRPRVHFPVIGAGIARHFKATAAPLAEPCSNWRSICLGR
jgi:threonine dehydratase